LIKSRKSSPPVYPAAPTIPIFAILLGIHFPVNHGLI
jgi:hypothetical protein